MTIRRGVLAALLMVLALAACSPILERQLSERAFVNAPLASMAKYPLFYKDDLYLLGGLIIESKQTERGILIEALYIPVNRRGYIEDQDLAQGTYLALLPADVPGIDTLTYRPGIYISAAAEFVGTETGITSGEKQPLFEVRDIHVWGDEYIQAFGLPPGRPGRPSEDLPVNPEPVWENPLSP